MYNATDKIVLPTTITGSLPRPDLVHREPRHTPFPGGDGQPELPRPVQDAVTCYLRDQDLAGLDIVTDGDAHYDDDVGGQSWTSFPPNHMSGSITTTRCNRRPAVAASRSRAATSCTTTSNRA